MNNEGVSLWKSGQPIINILENTGTKPGERLYHAEWRILKSLLMQVINPFSEATISFNFKNNRNDELYTGGFKSYKKKFRKLVDAKTSEEYDVFFRSKWFQIVRCELLAGSRQLYCWNNDNNGGAIIYENDKPIAYITSKIHGIGNYKQINMVTNANNELLLALIAIVYSY